MEVIRANEMGFCMGVRRAVDIVYEAVKGDFPRPVYTFGPIIHNRPVIEDLERLGVGILDDPEKAEGTVIIRAHGVAPEIHRRLKEKAALLIDATCTRVRRSQERVKAQGEAGRPVVIAGDRDHGEVQGLAGFAPGCVVVETAEEAAFLDVGDNTLLVAQTTFDEPTYNRIWEEIKRKNPTAERVETLCPATRRRGEAIRELAARVEAILVVGGKNSANTIRLFHAAEKVCGNAWHIEDEREIPPEIRMFTTVGISAGASTPDWVIRRVEEALLSLSD